MGALIIGPRLGRYTWGMTVFPGSSTLATLGTFILWLGWFGFNGASQLAMGTVGDVSDVSKIFVNTNMAAAAGVVVAIILTQLRYGKADTTMALNGALAGLVAITAEPLTPNVGMAIVIGGIGGALPVIFVPILDKLKIDDVVGAIPVHLAGIWGTLAVPLCCRSALRGADPGVVNRRLRLHHLGHVWFALKATVGVRPSAEEEWRVSASARPASAPTRLPGQTDYQFGGGAALSPLLGCPRLSMFSAHRLYWAGDNLSGPFLCHIGTVTLLLRMVRNRRNIASRLPRPKS